MPIFRAVVEGQNFPFVVDGEEQLAGFHKTMYLEAENDNNAADLAIDWVKNDLTAKNMSISQYPQPPSLELDELVEVSAAGYRPGTDEDYIWYLADEINDDFGDAELDEELGEQ